MDIWRDCDEPFATVAACDEYIRLLDGKTDVCKVLTEWDGTASGLQHLTAGCRDGELAPLVNITSNATPGDIYSKVSARAEQIVARRLDTVPGYIDPRLATERLPYEWKFDRSAAKAGGSMTLAYGARPISARRSSKPCSMSAVLRGFARSPKAQRSSPLPSKGMSVMKVTEKDIDPRMTDYASALWNGVTDPSLVQCGRWV